ncbi:MAG: hypothetical protein C7B46_11040 [Sulfobacillus benefaciens]|uniref:Uncharacterized protein n=1 Tax=Sulfobacillus benefaciens TaxID=453960 RepID=A0A2T2XFF5_9FIRM|nr:MAG: hypothetical protein C7B46_11040 [Sulfobacillus benefaciens]
MDVNRIVPIPLVKAPTVMWGLHLKDLIWLAMGVVVDLALWPRHQVRMTNIIAMGLIGAVSLGLAWGKYEEVPLSEWLYLMIRYLVRPRTYISH